MRVGFRVWGWAQSSGWGFKFRVGFQSLRLGFEFKVGLKVEFRV